MFKVGNIIALIAGLGVCAPAIAGGQGQKHHEHQGASAQQASTLPGQSEQATMKREVREISGQIVRTKQVDVRGTDGANVVALISTRGGKRVVADLGSRDKFKDVQLNRGTQVELEGFVARLGDRYVVVGDKLTTQGKSYDLSHKHSKTKQN